MSIVDELKDQLINIQAKILKIQQECSHPEDAVTKKHGSNTGNYDPSADCYWTDFHCSLCDARWHKDGSL